VRKLKTAGTTRGVLLARAASPKARLTYRRGWGSRVVGLFERFAIRTCSEFIRASRRPRKLAPRRERRESTCRRHSGWRELRNESGGVPVANLTLRDADDLPPWRRFSKHSQAHRPLTRSASELMWMPYSIKTRRPVAVILDIENIDSDVLPDQLMRTSVSFAEPASGPHATDDPIERARRQDRLQRAEATFESLPFDHAAARVWDDLRSRPCRWQKTTRRPRYRPSDRRGRPFRTSAALHTQPG
jgi:hypothetical protein